MTTDSVVTEMPPYSTAVKGKHPPRMVPATPKGGGRPPARGRVTRSAVKGSRASSCQPAAAAMVAQTPTGCGRAGGGSRVTRSAIKGKAPGDGGGRDTSPPATSIEVRGRVPVTIKGEDGGSVAEAAVTSRIRGFVAVP